MKTFAIHPASLSHALLRRDHALLALCLALAVNPLFATFDPVAWKLGGLRGVVVGPASDEHPFQSEGTTVKLKDGTLLHAFNLRYGEKDMSQWHPHYARTVIAQVLSRDGGRTWSAPAVMFESNTGINASHAAVRRLANGELGATYQRINAKPVEQWDRANWIRSIRNADKIFRYSQDEGKTWSKEILISPDTGYWTSAHDRLLVHSSGRLLQPLHSNRAFFEGKSDRVETRVAYSDDQGRTWHLSFDWLAVTDLAPGYIGNYKSNFHEVAIAERADGSIYLIGRTSAGRLYWSESRDRGETWTKPAPSPLLSPESPAIVARLPGSDDLVLIWNSQSVTDRNTHVGQRLTLASTVSSDGGRTWGDYREIITIPPNPGNPRQGFGNDRVCYPSIYFDAGSAYIGYWAGARVDGRQYDQQYMMVLPVSFFTALRETHRPVTFTSVK
ncbi:MAG: exo-alpha-sialidase [Verrucomicrobia bacterium]|nr:exo-alpha-sialidase [Verrucomicrobiota bacterium]